MTIDLTRLVKPLEWALDSGKHTYPQRMKAIIPGGIGDYTVFGSSRKNEWMWCRNGYFVDGYQMQEAVSLAAAQAAANADNARVLAAIDTALIAGLVEAATEVGRISDRDHVAWHRLAAALAKLNEGA
jgi:hypothetical protein